MHADRSKSMNRSAFSCGERSWVWQPSGKSVSTWSVLETWMSLKTTRPQS
jgi:hypothetical protein